MTFEDLRDMLAEQFECDAGTITEDTLLGDDLGADDLDLTELSWQLSEAADVKLSEDDLENAETVGDVWQIVRESAGEPGTGSEA
jgi:acyl carrier protein